MYMIKGNGIHSLLTASPMNVSCACTAVPTYILFTAKSKNDTTIKYYYNKRIRRPGMVFLFSKQLPGYKVPTRHV